MMDAEEMQIRSKQIAVIGSIAFKNRSANSDGLKVWRWYAASKKELQGLSASNFVDSVKSFISDKSLHVYKDCVYVCLPEKIERQMIEEERTKVAAARLKKHIGPHNLWETLLLYWSNNRNTVTVQQIYSGLSKDNVDLSIIDALELIFATEQGRSIKLDGWNVSIKKTFDTPVEVISYLGGQVPLLEEAEEYNTEDSDDEDPGQGEESAEGQEDPPTSDPDEETERDGPTPPKFPRMSTGSSVLGEPST